MKIELLYFDGCPNWQDARRLVEEVLAESGVEEPVSFVEVTSNDMAQEVGFIGSPSVRIDGKDVDPDAADNGFNMECRLYHIDGRMTGVPAREWVAQAVEEATTK